MSAVNYPLWQIYLAYLHVEACNVVKQQLFVMPASHSVGQVACSDYSIF